MSKLNRISNLVAIVATTIATIVTLYAFIPQVMAKFSPLNEAEVSQMIRQHKSFASDGNVEGMMSLYHPDFSMEVVYASGRKEKFDRSQLSKHLELIIRNFSRDVEEKALSVSIVNDSQALVSLIEKQKLSLSKFSLTDDQVFQTMLIVKHDEKPKIVKVISTSIK